jgi:Tol biopolymer transport system component
MNEYDPSVSFFPSGRSNAFSVRCIKDPDNIYFESDRDGNPEIYAKTLDGTYLQRLTSNTGIDAAPRQSPNHTKVGFITDRDGIFQVYYMNTDGSDDTLLIPNYPGMTNLCGFTPLGEKVMYFWDLSGHEEPSGRQLDDHLFLINNDGSANKDISINKPDGYNDTFGSILDNNDVIFTSGANTIPSIPILFLMDITGNQRHQFEPNGYFPHGH